MTQNEQSHCGVVWCGSAAEAICLILSEFLFLGLFCSSSAYTYLVAMAKLQGAFLPSNPFFADASTSREPKSFHLSKFKFRVSMATTTSFADTSMSNQRSQQAQFPLTAKRTRKPTDNRRAESNTGIAYYLSLLNSNCVSDFKQVHALAVKLNAFEMDCYIANKLAVLYTRNMESLDYARFARNGEIDLAIQYLEEMQEKGLKPRVNTWNGIISGCAQNKYFEDALDAFYDMLWFPEVPNFVTIASVLPACAGLKNLNLGRAIHGYSLKRQLCNNVHVEGSLIDMYSKCGRNDYSEKVFVGAEVKNTAMWNEMIAAFVNKGKMEGTVELLRLMQNNDSKPDLISYNTILSGLARNGQKDEAYELLTEMVKIDLKLNIVSFNVLISGFQQSGLTYEALKLFQTMQSPSSGCFLNDAKSVFDLQINEDVGLWNALISSYMDHGMTQNAIASFEQMELSRMMLDY
ncbi:hypothetical protein FEM48_Zijuj06G0121900 [Ziziphus jujuba var. spinosa]|uniref:Uncharacterized protein n=1 Tax=Ziziphus jujuba var. spinosa TaxID=714518 RepID=A0A978V977_ZIZJJ|nr:hypothetical protein FEM48_Zijuj06G0121900 [Ziziphus jujuba var. spinosa]